MRAFNKNDRYTLYLLIIEILFYFIKSIPLTNITMNLDGFTAAEQFL